jgi:hypothetical protein
LAAWRSLSLWPEAGDILRRVRWSNPGELIASGILVLIAGALASLLYLGMRSAEALRAALAYWGITFWMPLAFGGLALRLLEHRRNSS